MTERDITRAQFGVILSRTDWAIMSSAEQGVILRHIERSCYNETIERAKVNNINRTFANPAFSGLYADIVYKVCTHLDPESDINRHYEERDMFVKKILSGEISADTVATCTYEQMRPEVNRKIREDIEVKLNVKDERKVSHEYTCRNCGCNETTYEIGQVRGGDENTTKFVKCTDCYLQWKVHL